MIYFDYFVIIWFLSDFIDFYFLCSIDELSIITKLLKFNKKNRLLKNSKA